MANVTWKLSGGKELERALGELKTATARSVARRTLKEAGEPVARTARSLAPVDQRDLVESIDVSERLAPSVRREQPKKSAMEMYVGPGQHPQAITQEFGTWFHPAQPFMRPAWASTQLLALDIMVTLLGIEVEKAARRARRKALKAKG